MRYPFLQNNVIIKKLFSLHWRFPNRVYGINITATIEKELASTMGSRKSRPMQCNVAFSIGDEGVRKFIQQVTRIQEIMVKIGLNYIVMAIKYIDTQNIYFMSK